MTASPLVEQYEDMMSVARNAFEVNFTSWIDGAKSDPKFLERFLFYFSFVGTRMTAPVEDWLARAADKCNKLGFTHLSHALNGHSKVEAGHDKMMLRDSNFLAKKLGIDCTTVKAPSAGAEAYMQLHEELIASDTPWRQIALEYEIEMLPVRYGPMVQELALGVLGSEIKGGLTFIEEHIVLDVGHTKFNLHQLESVLKLHPDAVESCADVGRRALEAYAQFVDDCVKLAA